MKDFEDFLITKDYDLGVSLYQKYGTDNFLKSLFAQNRSDFRANKLLSEIEKIIAALNQKQAQVKSTKTTLPSESPDAPEAIKSAITKRKELYKQASRGHARLEDIQTDAERFEVAKMIITNFKKIAPLWDLTNFYDTHLRLPQKVDLSNQQNYAEKSSVELNSIWMINYKYIHREKNNSSKIEQCEKRRSENNIIKQILEERTAFMYPNLTL